MVLPPETLNCFDIPPVKAGWVRLRPLTLGDVAILARAGIDVLAPLGPGEVEAVFALLSGEVGVGEKSWRESNLQLQLKTPTPFRRPRFMRLRCTARQRQAAVARSLDIAFRNAVAGHVEGERTVFSPSGYGWPLEMAERMMHEYGLTFDEAAAMPMVRIYSLLACARIRGGGKAGGPDYWERETLKDINGKGASR